MRRPSPATSAGSVSSTMCALLVFCILAFAYRTPIGEESGIIYWGPGQLCAIEPCPITAQRKCGRHIMITAIVVWASFFTYLYRGLVLYFSSASSSAGDGRHGGISARRRMGIAGMDTLAGPLASESTKMETSMSRIPIMTQTERPDCEEDKQQHSILISPIIDDVVTHGKPVTRFRFLYPNIGVSVFIPSIVVLS